jgi:hypothetical protein
LDRNVSIHLCFKGNKTEQNRTFVFSKNDIKTKPKRYKLRQGFSKTKQNVLIIKKNFGNGTKQKAFGPKILRTDRKRFVSIQNLDLKTFTFDLFWNESSKTEASDLERSLI